ncbi:MAG: extracellular solute-binding protein, partial [Ardenticatenaceae bacterium]
EYRVGSILYATVLGYNTDEFSEAPEGWADFFDMEKFPGTRSLPQTASRYVMEVALIADGVDPADLYPLDIKRALGVLDKIKDDVIFWETGSQSAQQLADEEAVMGMLWNGRIQTAIDEGAPLAIQWNEHVALPDYFAVPKGAPNKVEAMKLIAYMVSEEHNHKISDFISYAPVNVNTFDKINPDMAPLLPTYEDRPSLGFQVSDAWWDDNRDVVSEAYNAWLLGEDTSSIDTSSSESSSEGTGTVTMVSWGGAYQEAQTNAYLTPYEEETGVTVVQDGPTDYAKIIAMVEAGQVTWDVVDIENDFAVGQTEQYFEPIDYSIVPKDEILPGLADEYRVGSILYATVLGYNTDEFSEAPEGWADFFDMEKFPGTRSLPQTASRYVMEVALIADGVDPEDLYPLDVDRALGVLDKIKDDVIFWETGSQSAQQLADEEAVMGMLWNGRIQTAIDEGAPLAIQWNQHVALPDYFAVPKGAKNKVEAMKLIAYMVSEEHNHKISDFISYA